jgi:hypothetical protein
MVAALTDATTRAQLNVIHRFLQKTKRTPTGSRPLCLGCDSEFYGQLDWLIAITTPFIVASKGTAIINTVCPDCAKKEHPRDLVLRSLRTVMDFEVVQAGHG